MANSSILVNISQPLAVISKLKLDLDGREFPQAALDLFSSCLERQEQGLDINVVPTGVAGELRMIMKFTEQFIELLSAAVANDGHGERLIGGGHG